MNPPTLMRCKTCGRHGRAGEHQGDTCGDPIDKPFVVLTDAETIDAMLAAVTWVPLPASHPASIARDRCLGILLYPYLVDEY